MLKNPELWLRKGADRRLRGGHEWIYSNEIDTARSPLGEFEAGDAVTIRAAGGDALGAALMEPNSLICARRYSREPDAHFDHKLCAAKIESALALRQQFFTEPYYRLIYGDSDGLSGVIVDRFGDYLVVQLNTAGVERHEHIIIEALAQQLQPAGILLRADSRARREQHLEDRVEVVSGSVPEVLALVENGVQFLAPVQQGQKTGWFYDHRDNRALLQQWVAGKRVLDVYSYVGGWGVQAASAGARQVSFIDVSDTALDCVAASAELNGVGDRIETLQGRADQRMQELAAAGEKYDVVVLDPPAFIPRKRDLGKGRKAYQRINELALKLVSTNGLLVSGSCSMHLSFEDLQGAMRAAAARSNARLQIVHQGGQGADHPVHAAINETRYLKALFARVGPP